jgi:hypothetical protein
MESEYLPRMTISEISFLDRNLIKSPGKMLSLFTGYFDLRDCKEHLWDMMKGFFISFYTEEMDSIERSNYFAFYEQLLAMIEATYLLQERKLAKGKRKNNDPINTK